MKRLAGHAWFVRRYGWRAWRRYQAERRAGVQMWWPREAVRAIKADAAAGDPTAQRIYTQLRLVRVPACEMLDSPPPSDGA